MALNHRKYSFSGFQTFLKVYEQSLVEEELLADMSTSDAKRITNRRDGQYGPKGLLQYFVVIIAKTIKATTKGIFVIHQRLLDYKSIIPQSPTTTNTA